MPEIQISPFSAGDIVSLSYQWSQFFVPEYRVLRVDSYLRKAYLEGLGWQDWGVLELVEQSHHVCLTPSGNTGSEGQTLLLAPPLNGGGAGGVEPAPLRISDVILWWSRYRARVDWLQGTVLFHEAQEWNKLTRALWQILDLKFTQNPTGFTRGKSYKSSGYAPGGVMAAWSYPTDENPIGEGWLSIPGRVLGSLPINALYSMWELLSNYKFKATRLDCALDCYEPHFSCEDVLTAARQGNFTGFRHRPTTDKAGNKKAASYDFHASPFVDKNGEQHEGYSIYFGRAGGDKRLTFYDKLAEALNNAKNSGLTIDEIYKTSNCIRVEGRFYDEQAQIRFYDLLQDFQTDREGKQIARKIACMVTGAIDFKDRSVDKRLDRCPQLEWWEEVCKCFERLTYPVPRPMASLERSIEWHFRQVAASFAVVEEVFGFSALNQYLNKLLCAGRTKLGQAHEALIDLSVAAVCQGRLSLEAFYQQWNLAPA